jgi:hypothetical protein
MLERLPQRTPLPRRQHTAILRRAATGLLAATLAGALVTGCGFNDATERIYTPANGANENSPESSVAVLGAAVVSTEPGAGTFIAVISNKSLEDAVSLVGVAGIEENQSVTSAEFAPQKAEPGSYVDLSDELEVKLTGDFEAGNFVRLALTFDNGDRVPINVPVVANAGDFSDLDGPAPAPSPAEETEESHG